MKDSVMVESKSRMERHPPATFGPMEREKAEEVFDPEKYFIISTDKYVPWSELR